MVKAPPHVQTLYFTDQGLPHQNMSEATPCTLFP
jgi:hypothetical protein